MLVQIGLFILAVFGVILLRGILGAILACVKPDDNDF